MVSVDCGDVDELARGRRRRRRLVLSPATRRPSMPSPAPSAFRSSCRGRTATSIHSCAPSTRPRPRASPHIADPVIDPIHFGFMASLERYAELRRRRPDVEIMMGTGNLTELTDADSQGVTAILLGICSELQIRNVLVVQVSPHTPAHRGGARRRAPPHVPRQGGREPAQGLRRRPAVAARLEALSADARRDRAPRPRASGTTTSASRPPATASTSTIATAITSPPIPSISSPSSASRADGAHAFYLGYELAKAEIAIALGKRYAQDNPLDWGVAAGRRART